MHWGENKLFGSEHYLDGKPFSGEVNNTSFLIIFKIIADPLCLLEYNLWNFRECF
jgi:hypothetical protein